MSRYSLLFLNGAILTVCAVFIYGARAMVLTGLMLFLPFVDRQWQIPFCRVRRAHQSPYGAHGAPYIWLSLVACVMALLVINPQHASTALMIFLFTALPEEWFFRAYVQTRIEQLITDKAIVLSPVKGMWLANIVTSTFFALIHLPVQGILGLLVLMPSLLFGWLYQAYRDIALVILLHTLSNLIFIIYIRDKFSTFF